MNQLQKDYAMKKAAYEAAFKMENWDLVDKLEDPMIEAEFKLMDWCFEVVEKTGQMSSEDIDLLRRNSNLDQWDKMVDMALRLAA
jgi:hypothetical protein